MNVFKALRCALELMTRLPVPRSAALPEPGIAGMSTAFFPAIGLLLGGASAAVPWAMTELTGGPAMLASALLVVGLHVLLTGALHLDGLADVADGIGGGRDRGRTLEIMRDTRLGSFGGVALAWFLMAKTAALWEVMAAEEARSLLVVFPAAARFAVMPLIAFFPYARPEGLGRSFHDHSGWKAVFFAAVLFSPAVVLAGPVVWIPSAAALVAALLLACWLQARLGGLTGDGYGAAIEVAEVAFLAAAVFPGVTP